ncbi:MULTISPECIES: HIRAN domain-containing protein [unclassified Mesorhizobium]|uniref:HIRAN domain-containing protein n=1 Tax=unclassified Mesorhizobium TaxID=325217 RepID=UPI0033352C31
MSDVFFINWQDPVTRRWYPVAKLQRAYGQYIFAYTFGALHSPNFSPFAGLTDRNAVYISSELFPIFANRVMNERRPEFGQYARWSGIHVDQSADPLLLMARMGGERATDTLEVHPVPELSPKGHYETVFFCHGMRHVLEQAQARTLALRPGEHLFPMLDMQNPFDPNAIALRSSDPAAMIGYCPRYLVGDLKKLAAATQNSVRLSVRQVNADAPVQFRLLCELVSWWPPGFTPCDDEEHRTIARFQIEDLDPDLHKRLRNF